MNSALLLANERPGGTALGLMRSLSGMDANWEGLIFF